MSDATVRLTAEVWREPGDQAYTSMCPELDVWSMGDTPAEAVAMLREAVQGYVELEPDALALRAQHAGY